MFEKVDRGKTDSNFKYKTIYNSKQEIFIKANLINHP